MKPLLTLSLLALVALGLAPLGQSDVGASAVDLGGTFDAGEFRAARIRLLEPQGLEVGGVFWDPVGTPHPVLPIYAAIRTAGGAGGFAVFTYDFHSDQALPTSLHLIAPNAGVHHLGDATTNQVQGGGWITFFELPAGEYVLVAALAPGDGEGEIKMRTFGAAEVVAVQDGTTFYDRGFDHSEVAYDVFVTGNKNPFTGTHLRAWSYSGAELDFPVGGRMWGYIGYHQVAARWVAPDGTAFPGFVFDEPGGAWKASFPAEEWTGPMCVPRLGCDPGFGDTREDPPFAIAADVRV